MKKLSTRLRPERRALILSICSACLSGTALIMGLVRCSANNAGLQNEVATCMSYSTSISATTSTTRSTTTSTNATTSTTSTSTTTSTTTTSTTLTTTVTEASAEPVTELQTEPVTEAQIEPVTETYVEPAPTAQSYISDYEHTLLCNIVAHEYGSGWVPTYDKACVVATVMNRVADPNFPSTIEGVLMQPYQFSGYYCTGSYYSTVTQSCIDAVDYYFAHQSEFPYYLYFDGNHYAADGSGPYNYFR